MIDTITADENVEKRIRELEKEIAKRERIERMLRENEAHYRLLAENTTDTIWVMQLDGIFTYHSPAVVMLRGLMPEEANRISMEDTMTPESVRKINEVFAEENGKPVDQRWTGRILELKMYRKDGSIITVETSVRGVKDAGGNVVALQGSTRDISERKKTELALREARKFNDRLIASMKDGFSVLDENGVHILVNPALCDMTGFSNAELVGHGPPHPYWPETERSNIEAAFQKTLTGETGDFDLTFLKKTGENFPVIVSSSQILNDSGNVTCYLATVKDVSKQKRSEVNLLRAKQEWEEIFQAVGHPTLILDSNHRILDANRAASSTMGIPVDQLKGKLCFEVFHGTGEPPPSCPLSKLLKSEKIEESEMEVEAIGGTYLVSCTPVFNEFGKLEKIIHIATDITKRKQAEDAVKFSENRYRAMVEEHTDVICRWLPDTRLTYANASYLELFNIEKGAYERRKWLEFVPEESREATALRYKEMVCNPQKTIYENAVTAADGKVRWFHWIEMPLFDNTGALKEFQSVGREITRRKENELKLKRNHQLVELVSDVQNKVLHETDVQEVYASMLNGILEITESSYGFMGEVFLTTENRPYIKNGGLITMQWDETEKAFPKEPASNQWESTHLESVFDQCLEAKGPVIINEPSDNPIKNGPKKPAAFIGIPLFGGDRFIGLIGLADRKGGYDQDIITFVQPLVSTFTTVIDFFRNREKRKTVEDALKKSENLFRNIFELASSGKSLILPDGRLWLVNKAFCEMLGYNAADLTQKTYTEITYPEDIDASQKLVRSLLDGQAQYKNIEKRYVRANGQVIWADVRTSLLRDDQGLPLYIVTVVNDITERKRMESANRDLEAQLYQAQKMESVGRLAGGIAHDFNNLLSVIVGYSELVVDSLPGGHPNKAALDEIHSAGLRAKGLTRQLLAFARKQVLEVKIIDLNEVVRGFEKMLRRLIEEDIRLDIKLFPGSLAIKADISQLEQILMNLVVNARDAMPNGGFLLIETNRKELDAAYANEKPDVAPGRYAMLGVSDTGMGMDKKILENIFEPFFTTKGKEKGTGLGLSTVYGIVKQHNGNIWAYSEPDHGTTFKIYIPLADEAPIKENAIAAKEGLVLATATVMVVEDDPSVRRLAYQMLSRHGYIVMDSISPADALELAEKQIGKIDLILTDVVMPGMTGPEIYEKIKKHHPESKVLYMSGYTDEIISYKGVLAEGTHFIQKPFSSRELLGKVTQILFP